MPIGHKKNCKCAFCKMKLFGKENPRYGARHSIESRKKMRKAKSGKNNPLFNKHHSTDTKLKQHNAQFRENSWGWVHGVPKNYRTLHRRICDLYGNAVRCENKRCACKSPKRFSWANKDHKYNSLSRKKWKMFCYNCHTAYDIKFNGKVIRNQYTKIGV